MRCREKSLRANFLLIRQRKAQRGRCRTAKTAERSDADAERRRSSAKSRCRPAGARASGLSRAARRVRRHGIYSLDV